MLASLRTYRLLAAFLAATLLFGGSLPLVQHACAMMLEHAGMHRCTEDEALPAHPVVSDHGGEAPAPCHEAAPPDLLRVRQHQAGMDCCVVRAAPGLAVQANPPDAGPTRLFVPSAPAIFQALPPSDAAPSPLLFFDTGPPPAPPLSLHLLHLVLLS